MSSTRRALGWLNQIQAKQVLGRDTDVASDDPALRHHLATALGSLNDGAGSASRVERLVLLSEPPNLDIGEITDKGYINQIKCLQTRAEAVAALYADPPATTVIVPQAAERA